MKKKIKIKYVGFWEGFIPEIFWLTKILKKYFYVEITDDADYIICSMFGTGYDYCNYSQVRIFVSGENYAPDFNLVDYAICSYPIKYLDRSLYLPLFLTEQGRCENLLKKSRNFTKEIFNEKKYFANFVYSHESENNIRGDFFKKLNNYKRVESAGTYLNNMPDGEAVSFLDGTKFEMQKKCKFSLCFESTKHEGFITEKILEGFYSETIPIYYGSKNVKEFFNPKAFINVSDYQSFDEVIEKIKEIDNDDEKYLEMLNQPVFNDEKQIKTKFNELEHFLLSIFNQSLDNAYRRSKIYSPQNIENKIKQSILIEKLTEKNETKINTNSLKEKIKKLIKIILRKPVLTKKNKYDFTKHALKLCDYKYLLINYNGSIDYSNMPIGEEIKILVSKNQYEKFFNKNVELFEEFSQKKKHYSVKPEYDKKLLSLYFGVYKIIKLSFSIIDDFYIDNEKEQEIFEFYDSLNTFKVITEQNLVLLSIAEIIKRKDISKNRKILNEYKNHFERDYYLDKFCKDEETQRLVLTILQGFDFYK